MAASEPQDSDGEALRDVPSINLIDHTRPVERPTDLEREPSGLTKTFTHGSIRQTLARRKYQRSKWQEGRGSQTAVQATPDLPENPAEEDNGEPSLPTRPHNASYESQDGAGDLDAWGKGRVRRGGRKVKDAIRSSNKQALKAQNPDVDSHVDILYENQRGFFFAGIPRFSSNSLLNFDPTAWLDGRFRPSAVNITNAQVPDPSWEWAWRCWYVDMSGDVDEEGWEYSFWFGNSAAWHGTHPWFHSFVRRRRWLRKRSKRKGFKAKEEAHALTADYFTIHSKVRPAGEDAESVATSEKKTQYSLQTSNAWGAKSWEDQAEIAEVTNIPDMVRRLKTAAVDREKIVLVRQFLDQAGEELHYLAENMEPIMKLLVFQNSRRQLLSILMHEFEAAEQHRDEHKDRGEEESDEEKRHIDNLLKAVEAADDQCKQLEYWSDVKDMTRDGDILRASAHVHGWDHTWQGLDTSGPSPPDGSPSDSEDLNDVGKMVDKGKQPLRTTDEIDVPGQWIDGAAKAKEALEAADSRRSGESQRTDVFQSPMEEKTQAQVMQRADTAQDQPTPSQESELSLDVYESAHSEPEDDDDDDQATERAPSEDERDDPDTPPIGPTPVAAIAKLLNGGAKEDQGTASQHSGGDETGKSLD
jgi:hypothetical protein